MSDLSRAPYISPGRSLIGGDSIPRWRQALQIFLPLMTSVFALVIGAVPLAPQGWDLAVPDFLAPTLFFWCVYQPRQVPVLMVFVLGGVADIIHATPLGVHSMAYMLLALAAKSQAEHLSNLGLLFNWGLFALAMLGFGLMKFFATLVGTPTALNQALWPALLLMVQLVLTTIVAYLLFYLVLSALNRWIIGVHPRLSS